MNFPWFIMSLSSHHSFVQAEPAMRCIFVLNAAINWRLTSWIWHCNFQAHETWPELDWTSWRNKSYCLVGSGGCGTNGKCICVMLMLMLMPTEITKTKRKFKHTTLNIYNVNIPLMIHIFMSRSTEHVELVIWLENVDHSKWHNNENSINALGYRHSIA